MIAHGVLSLDVGGLERIVVALARESAEPSMVICVERPGDLAGEANVRCLDKPPGRDAAYIDRAEALLRELQPRVVHTHQIGAAWYLAPAAKRLGLRVIHTEHGNPFARSLSHWQSLKLRLLMRQTAKAIDVFTCVSPDIAVAVTRWGTVPKHKVRVIPNGIVLVPPTRGRLDMRKQLGIAAEAFVIGSVGRLNEVKRQDLLLHAVSQSGTNATVLLVGDGPEQASLERLAEALKLRVIFAGYQPLPIDYLEAMDVFTLTSRSEGFPVSLLEAWSVKLPVVVSNVGGLPAIIRNGETGVLIPPADAPAFAHAFRQLHREPTLRTKLGAAGHSELLRKYTMDRMLEAYRTLYGKTS